MIISIISSENFCVELFIAGIKFFKEHQEYGFNWLNDNGIESYAYTIGSKNLDDCCGVFPILQAELQFDISLLFFNTQPPHRSKLLYD